MNDTGNAEESADGEESADSHKQRGSRSSHPSGESVRDDGSETGDKETGQQVAAGEATAALVRVKDEVLWMDKVWVVSGVTTNGKGDVLLDIVDPVDGRVMAGTFSATEPFPLSWVKRQSV